MLACQHVLHPVRQRRPIVDQQDAPVATRFDERLALGALDADLARGHRAHAQLVGHHFEPRQRANPRDQRHVGDRLG
jgi:hypothetical protein